MDNKFNNLISVQDKCVLCGGEVTFRAKSIRNNVQESRKVRRDVRDSIKLPLIIALAPSDVMHDMWRTINLPFLTSLLNCKSITRSAGALPPGAPGFSNAAS